MGKRNLFLDSPMTMTISRCHNNRDEHVKQNRVNMEFWRLCSSSTWEFLKMYLSWHETMQLVFKVASCALSYFYVHICQYNTTFGLDGIRSCPENVIFSLIFQPPLWPEIQALQHILFYFFKNYSSMGVINIKIWQTSPNLQENIIMLVFSVIKNASIVSLPPLNMSQS